MYILKRWRIHLLIAALCWILIVFANTPTISAQSTDEYFYDKFALQNPSAMKDNVNSDYETSQNEIPNDKTQYDETQILPTESTPIHYHSYTTNIIAPSCENDGYTIYICDCGETYNGDYVSKTSHEFGNWVVETKATVLSEGKKVRVCEHCNKIESESIPMLQGSPITMRDGVGNVLTYPRIDDFGKYIEQAEILYQIITTGDAGEHNEWPTGIYGPNNYAHIYLPIDGIDDLTTEQQEALADNITRQFTGKFNQNVSNGVIWVGCGMRDVVKGGVSIHFDPVALNARLNAQFNIDYKSLNLQAGLTNGTNEKDAVILINKWICDNISYNSGSDPYTVLNSKQAQCAGYASLFYMMCRNAGIDCQYIVGCIDGDSNCRTCHAWNRVKINDKWYWVDVCWNDTGSTQTQYLLSESLWSPRITCE